MMTTEPSKLASAPSAESGAKQSRRARGGSTSSPRAGLDPFAERTATQCELRLPSPLGELRLLATPQGLVGVHFPSPDAAQPARAPRTEDPAAQAILRLCAQQLTEYFAGQRTTFTVPLAASGTPFQRAVWGALVTIPFGHTCSYGQLAQQLGQPTAGRAVGAANGRNPIAVIVPCHRVIGANGTLTGYAGGLAIKEWLLTHERAQRPLRLGAA